MSKKGTKPFFRETLITDTATKGKSVAKAPDGRVIFISNGVPGDIADIQIVKKRKAYYEGEAVAFHQFSEKRTNPICEHFGICGGCKWQSMQYQYQLFYKEKEIIHNFKKIGHLKLPKITPILGADKTYFYRNKMEFSFSDNRWLSAEEINTNKKIETKNALGFHIAGMWNKILDIKKCYLQADPSNTIRNETKKFALANGLTFFNPHHTNGLLRTLMIRISSTGEIMVLLQFFEDDLTKRTLLLEFLKKRFPEITSLQYVINKKANDTIYDQEVVCFYGRNYIVEKMENLSFKINAKSFYQTNSEQAYELYKIARNFAELTGDELVYDLYTGTGTIAQFIAKKAKKVVGIESVPEAIIDARTNAQRNQIKNVSFFVGDMKKVFEDQFIAIQGQPDIIITNPPRDGMHTDVVKQILKIAPKRIVYVSCNSATQARDIALMSSFYKITKMQAVDMFPQTQHVENVVQLEKNSL